MASGPQTAVELYWLPLGADGHCVRHCGRVYEALSALRSRRHRYALFHAALIVHLAGRTVTIEVAPVVRGDARRRGVVAGGAVGSRRAGRLRIFRYEIRRWDGGTIPDLATAVDSPRVVTADAQAAQRLLDLVPLVPTPVWGRDELDAGEMWNSNSVVGWLIVCSGLDVETCHPPAGSRAPGWNAGILVAQRGLAATGSPRGGRSAAT